MKKLLTAFLVLGTTTLSAQTLFTYGKDSVSLPEFMRAYNKNNSGAATEKSIREYLDLYVASRLKIKEARELKYDTLPQIEADLQNLRSQITPSYINDRKEVDRLIEEAFVRSQKNIHIAHIFISNADPAAAEKKKSAVMQELRTKDFSEVARLYSDDPSVTANGGDLGWIAVFTLPYPLETLAYRTSIGGVSSFFASRAGYHLFKNLGERRDPGRMKAAQILLAFPPDADEATRQRTRKLADSIYNRLMKGDDFAKLSTQFSNDIIAAATGGQIPEFGAGQYDPAFEQVVFALPKDGAISKPFATSHGYHIVKRISRTPLSTAKDEKTYTLLREKVEASDRINAVKASVAEKIRKETQFQTLLKNNNELYLYSDSVLMGKSNGVAYTINSSTPVLKIGRDEVDVPEWISYVQLNRYRADGTGMKSYEELWKDFNDAMALRYYEKHLEDFNEEFRQQLTEFSEGNLFFEIMQRKVWGPAQNDSSALLTYYNAHKANYFWKPSADVIVFYAADKASANALSTAVRANPKAWKKLLDKYSEKIASDSSRMELEQIPNGTKLPVKAGLVTAPLVNATDNTASFAYVLRTYTKQEPRNFEEARGQVIADYQNELEKEWIAELQKKYPVKVNEDVVAKAVRK